MAKRYFFPSKPDKTQVHHWEWTKSRGLMVVYSDGCSCPSMYSLPELLKADHRLGDGLPCVERESSNEWETKVGMYTCPACSKENEYYSNSIIHCKCGKVYDSIKEIK